MDLTLQGTPGYLQAFVEDAACQDMGRALARLQDESCLQQKQGIHLDRENQGSEASESWETSKQQINKHSGTGAALERGTAEDRLLPWFCPDAREN